MTMTNKSALIFNEEMTRNEHRLCMREAQYLKDELLMDIWSLKGKVSRYEAAQRLIRIKRRQVKRYRSIQAAHHNAWRGWN